MTMQTLSRLLDLFRHCRCVLEEHGIPACILQGLERVVSSLTAGYVAQLDRTHEQAREILALREAARPRSVREMAQLDPVLAWKRLPAEGVAMLLEQERRGA